MRVLEGVTYLRCDTQRFLKRVRALRRFSFDQLHHQRAIFHSIDRGDVRVVQRGQHFRFALEARHALGIASERFRQNFDRHVALQFRVAGSIHFAHAARADGGQNFVGAQASSGSQGHGMWIDSTLLLKKGHTALSTPRLHLKSKPHASSRAKSRGICCCYRRFKSRSFDFARDDNRRVQSPEPTPKTSSLSPFFNKAGTGSILN
jgi:hypothetical protein